MIDALKAGRHASVPLLAFLLSFAVLCAALASTPDVLEAGASQNHFYIEPSYDGTSIALFGSVDTARLKNDPFDVVITLRGPVRPVTVWKKARRAGFWVNTESFTFDGVPNYYAVLSTKPLDDIASLEERKLREIGVDALLFLPAGSPESTPAAAPPEEYRDALIKLKRTSGLFIENNQAAIDFLGARLFRARVFLPPAAGPGLYRANFYVFQEGRLAGQATSRIRLNKIGIEAQLSSAAVQHPWLYGVLAVVLAAAVGGGASLVFRRA